LAEDVLGDDVVRPLRRSKIVRAEHLTEPLRGLDETDAPSRVVPETSLTLRRLRCADAAAARSLFTGKHVRRPPVLQRPDRAHLAVLAEKTEAAGEVVSCGSAPTVAPQAAKSLAAAAPMPRVAPVTISTLPARLLPPVRIR
jgi:hypothetical protein